MRHRFLKVLLGALGVLAITGCTGGSGAVGLEVASGPSCLSEPPAPAVSVAPTPSAGPSVPGLVLRCFGTSGRASLVELRAPAVVNLWASWCRPCRSELPAMQRLADATAGRMRVVGVITKDRRDSAQAFIDEAGLTFPMLEDRTQQLVTAVGQARNRPIAAIPVTLFITADGRIAHIYNGPELTDATLAELTARHLGVVVRS